MDLSKNIGLRCLCGSATTNLNLPKSKLPLPATFCHCNSCRHMSGCLCLTSIPLPTEIYDQQQLQALSAKLTAFEFSKNQIMHYFCPNCGTHMLANVLPRQRNGYKDLWSIICGSLDNAEQIYHPQHDYIADTIDGGAAVFLYSLNGITIERWAGHPKQSEQLPLEWTISASASDRNQTSTANDDKLHAYCKCRGVEFWISRPVPGSKYAVEICACHSCRLSTGMEWIVGARARIPITHIFLDKEQHFPSHDLSFGTLKAYSSSSGLERSFCSTCGASVFSRKRGENSLGVAVGLLDAPEGARAETWLDWRGHLHQYQAKVDEAEQMLTMNRIRHAMGLINSFRVLGVRSSASFGEWNKHSTIESVSIVKR